MVFSQLKPLAATRTAAPVIAMLVISETVDGLTTVNFDDFAGRLIGS